MSAASDGMGLAASPHTLLLEQSPRDERASSQKEEKRRWVDLFGTFAPRLRVIKRTGEKELFRIQSKGEKVMNNAST